MAKCVMKILKQDVTDASGSLQVCAGLKCGSEAAIHAKRKFEADDNDAVLLIDGSNAFNSLNRSAALHNIIKNYMSNSSNFRHKYLQRTITPFHNRG